MAALDEVFERAHPLSFPHLLHPKLLPFLLLLLQPHFVLLFYLLGLGPLLLLQGEPQSEVHLRQLVEHEHLGACLTRLARPMSEFQPASNELASHPGPWQESEDLQHPARELLRLDMVLFDVGTVVAWFVDKPGSLADMAYGRVLCAHPS